MTDESAPLVASILPDRLAHVSDNASTALTGAQNAWTVGYDGTGVLNITGGNVNTGSLVSLGRNAGSSGTATVSSGTWTNSGALYVGLAVTGELNVAGGAVSNTDGYLGSGAGSISPPLKGSAKRSPRPGST